MRIEIVSLLDADQVAFRCAVGTATGVWRGETPAVPGPADVEFDIPAEDPEFVVLRPPAPAAVHGAADGAVTITGTVIGIGAEGDPVLEVRVDSDIVLVEVTDRRRDLAVGDGIELRVPVLQLYPYQL